MHYSEKIKPITYEKQKDALILLKLLAQSTESIKKGRYKSIKYSFASIRKRIKDADNKKRNCCTIG